MSEVKSKTLPTFRRVVFTGFEQPKVDTEIQPMGRNGKGVKKTKLKKKGKRCNPEPESLEEVTRVLKSLEFKNPGPMMRDDPLHTSGHRSRRPRVFLGDGKRRSTQPPLYNSRGRLIAGDTDLCDCLEKGCVGCFFPCPRCKSSKCGVECRNTRKWTIKWIYFEDRPDHPIENPCLFSIKQQLKKDQQECF